MHHAFLHISLPSLHDYHVKMPNFTFCEGRKLPWVPETFLARFPVSVKSFVASAFGQHRKFPPHARKTSGTQGTTGALRRSALLPDVFTQFTSEYFAHEKSSLDGC